MLLFSTGTGIYFGYIRKKIKPVQPISNLELNTHKKEPDFGSKAMSEYLLGSRKLKVFPVAMSLVARLVFTMLGVPSEIYTYGTQYWLIIVPIILMAFVVSKVYLPVFSTLNVGSSYEVCTY
ncbi:sodium-coupled monocarboxylate transporter 1-like, partial [Rhagoletis pomonella]|uniref:sodium-coupled monocarboxylate transporter 1-like n=1 Tax=Rhagoletis pomonella TaxID=28610 RepID=UPI0017810325